MELEKNGFPRPTGDIEQLAADSVVLAIGQDVDRSIVDGVRGIEVRDGVVQVGADLMTGRPGVFAGGDMAPGERTVTSAVGHGKRAARCTDGWLRHSVYAKGLRSELAAYENLNTWYYSDAPASVAPRRVAARRVSTFDEVVGGLDDETALFEARRCLSCGNCFECDNCYGLCP